jgi:DNA sulfur modification protein DndD
VKITRIQLVNFRQHRNLDLDLSGSGGEFAIIIGRNGAGKTNLLKGITWVLSGRLALDEQKFQADSLVSHGAIVDSGLNDQVDTYGAIELDLGDGATAKIEREARFTRTETGLRSSGGEVVVNTMKNPKMGYQREPDAEMWIEQYLPSRFSHYFLFDGEHLNRFFRDTEAKYVEQAVLEIASIDQLSRMVEHLDSVAKDLTKAAAQGQGAEADQNALNFQDYIRRLDEVREVIAAKREEANDFREKISDVSARLGDVKSVEADMNRRNEFEAQAQAASDRAMNARMEMESWVMRHGANLMLEPALQTLTATIQKAHDDKVLPPPFKAEALAELLKSKKCLCGESLEPGTDACLHIEKLLSDFTTLSEVGAILSEIQVPLYGVVSASKQSHREITSVLERIKTAVQEERDATAQFDILRKKLAGNDDEAISLLSRNLDKYQEDFAATEREIGRLENQETHFIAEIEVHRRKIETQAAANEKSREALAKSKFAQEALRVATELYGSLSTQVREEVARTLDEEFQSMIWKDTFQPIEVDEHYRVLVRNKKGFEVREGLSAGETACLAFAFSLTLSKVAGFFYPMVVDSPFGRLDSEVREFVSVVLARVLKANAESSGNQLIMLMTDGEYTDNVGAAMAASKPRMFELDFDQLTEETTIQGVGN